jgi:hypothetical protein
MTNFRPGRAVRSTRLGLPQAGHRKVALLPFDPNGVAVRLDEIDDWSNHAKLVWEAAFRTVGKLSD